MLQTTTARQWQPVRLTDSAFYRKLYRLDPDDHEDWGSVVAAATSSDGPRPPGRGRDPANAMQREYAATVLKPETFYSVPLPRQSDNPDQPAEEEEDIFFQVMAVSSSGSRAKNVETLLVDAEEEARTRAGVAVQVQYATVFSRYHGGVVSVFYDSDPLFMNALDLAPFTSLRTRLQEWSAEISDRVGCTDLSNARLAAPTTALEDDKTPTLMLVEHLRAAEWAPMNGTVVHSDMTLQFDGRKPETKKQYFKVLMKLEQHLQLQGSVRSDQPQNYFKCIHGGFKVEPNLGDAWYKQRLSTPPGEMLALPAPPVALPLGDAPDSGDDEFDVVGVAAAAPKPKPKPRAARKAVAKAKADVVVPFALLDAPEPKPPSSSSASTSSNESSEDSMFDVVGAKRSRVSEWHVIECPGCAVKVKLDSYKPTRKERYQRYIARCPIHKDCTKKRNANLTASYGPVEPIAFLFAWADLGKDVTAEQHRNRHFKVPSVNVARFVGKLGNPAKALTDKAAAPHDDS